MKNITILILKNYYIIILKIYFRLRKVVTTFITVNMIFNINEIIESLFFYTLIPYIYS